MLAATSSYSHIISQAFESAKFKEKNQHFLFGSFFTSIYYCVFPNREKELKIEIDKLLLEHTDDSNHLVIVKGIYSVAQEHISKINDNNLKDLIQSNNSLIKKAVQDKEAIDKIILEGFYYKEAELNELSLILREIIDTLYDSLRLFIKYTKKLPIPPTETAKLAAEISANTIKSIYAR